jgi:hypothetical protein
LQESKAKPNTSKSLQEDKDTSGDKQSSAAEQAQAKSGQALVEKRRVRTREERRQRELEREAEQAKARREQIWRYGNDSSRLCLDGNVGAPSTDFGSDNFAWFAGKGDKCA